jgi:hypothetical protein
MDIRRQGFFGAVMLSMNDPEYTGIMGTLAAIVKKLALQTVKKAA